MDLVLNSEALSPSNSPTLGMEVETSENVAMSTALLNPIVLEAIFGHLDVPDLKTTRLVCRDWNELGTTVLGKQSCLHVTPIFCYHTSDLHLIAPIHPKLMRNVIISSEFDASIHLKKTAAVIAKGFTILPEFTGEIKFYARQRKFIRAFLDGMTMLKSTKIRAILIYMHETNANECFDERQIQACRKLPVQTSLTSLHFDISHDTGRTNGVQTALQVLIDSAPNLTHLFVNATFYPNLEGCQNLKFLKFYFIQFIFGYVNCAHATCPDFKLGAVIKMLEQVKDSLIELELDFDGPFESVSQDMNLDVPVLSKLTSVTINFLMAYQIQNFFDEAHLPNLKNLVFGNYECGATELSSFLNVWQRHRGVQSLALELGQDFMEGEIDFGQKIVQLFPSVKKLEFMVQILGDVNSEKVKTKMGPFQKWNLKESSVVVYFEKCASVVRVLKSLSFWKGVKNVRFVIESYDFSIISAIAVQHIILHNRGLKTVKVEVKVKDEESAERMRASLETTSIPDSFNWNVCVTSD